MSGTDICKERDREVKEHRSNAESLNWFGVSTVAAGGYMDCTGVGAPAGFLTSMTGGGMILGAEVYNIWINETNKNTQNYKKEHGIRY